MQVREDHGERIRGTIILKPCPAFAVRSLLCHCPVYLHSRPKFLEWIGSRKNFHMVKLFLWLLWQGDQEADSNGASLSINGCLSRLGYTFLLPRRWVVALPSFLMWWLFKCIYNCLITYIPLLFDIKTSSCELSSKSFSASPIKWKAIIILYTKMVLCSSLGKQPSFEPITNL